MKTHNECKRGFTHLSAAWYGKACLADSEKVDEVMIGFYHPDGGTTGEFAIRWTPLGGKITPRLEAFDDSWHALYEFRDVLKKLAEHDSQDPSPEVICALLVACGVEDMTQRKERSNVEVTGAARPYCAASVLTAGLAGKEQEKRNVRTPKL